jgi:hypothetical protein
VQTAISPAASVEQLPALPPLVLPPEELPSLLPVLEPLDAVLPSPPDEPLPLPNRVIPPLVVEPGPLPVVELLPIENEDSPPEELPFWSPVVPLEVELPDPAPLDPNEPLPPLFPPLPTNWQVEPMQSKPSQQSAGVPQPSPSLRQTPIDVVSGGP